MDDELLTTRQVAERYGLNEVTLRYYRHAGVGPASFVLGGRNVRYRKSKVDAWVAEQEAASTRGGGSAA